jgi:hypothetical protein
MAIVVATLPAGCAGDEAAVPGNPASSSAASPTISSTGREVAGDAGIGGQPKWVRLDETSSIPLTEELKLGSVSDPNIGFSVVEDVVVSRSGLVLVLDSQDRKVKVYDSLGAPLYTIGRQGQGPGEFDLPRQIGLLEDTLLWVSDGAGRRITLFDLDGTLRTTVPTTGITLPIPGVANTRARVSPREPPRTDGLFDSNVSVNLTQESLPESFEVPALLFDVNGRVVDTAGSHVVRPRDGEGRSLHLPNMIMGFANPLYDLPLGARYGSDSIIVRRAHEAGDEANLTITRARLRAGEPLRDTVFHIDLAYTPRPVPQAFKDSVVESIVDRVGRVAQRIGDARAEADIRAQIEPARAITTALMSRVAYFPPIDVHHLGEDGAVWLRLSAFHRNGEGGVERWVILAPTGVPLGHVDLKPRSTVVWSRGEIAWIVERDAVDIPWVVRYRLAGN